MTIGNHTQRSDLMAKRGRPLKEIDQSQFEKLCALQCTQEEMCGFFNVDDKTLEGWCKRTYGENFSEVFKIKRGTGKVSLRRNQWKMAETNPTMAIWLGKQYLGQRDTANIQIKQEIEQETIDAVEALIHANKGTK